VKVRTAEIIIVVLLVINVIQAAALITISFSGSGQIHNDTVYFDKLVVNGNSSAVINLSASSNSIRFSDYGLELGDASYAGNYSELNVDKWINGIVLIQNFIPGINLEVHDLNENGMVDKGDYILIQYTQGPLPELFQISMYPKQYKQGTYGDSATFSFVSGQPSVTFYEASGGVFDYTFSASSLMHGGGYFYTWGHERYDVSSDGTNVTVKCVRDDYLSGFSVGNNIVAVRLNGIAGHPDDLWASKVVNYTLGYNGISDSVLNALGDANEVGYGNSTCTYLGDQYSEITLAFDVPVMEL